MARSDIVSPRSSRFTMLASICVIVAALYFARDVLVPLALAMLLTFLLTPVVKRFERWGAGRVPSVLIAVTLTFGLILVLGYVVGLQLYDIASNIDQYKENIVSKIDTLRPGEGGLWNKLRRTADEMQENLAQPGAASTQPTQPTDPPAGIDQRGAEVIGRELSGSVSPRAPATGPTTATAAPVGSKQNPIFATLVPPELTPLRGLSAYLGLVLSPLGTAGIVVVFVIFMLLQRQDLRSRLIRLASNRQSQLTIATQALDDAGSRISRYLLAQAVVNGTYGAAVSIGLWIIGATIGRRDPSGSDDFPSVILWGLLCALVRFVPYIGPWIGAALPLLISLAVYKGFGVFGATLIMFVVIELISNNVMEPWLYGASTGISAVAVLVAAVFWTWLWGPIGLLLSTPLTSVLVVLGKYIPQLAFLDVLLGDEPVMSPPARLYQRLLALDPEESAELAREFRKEVGSLERVYDELLLPALAMAEQDRHRGSLDERREAFVRETLRDIIDELGDDERAGVIRAEAADVAQRARGDEPTSSNSTIPVVSNDTDAAPRRPRLPKDCTVNVVLLPAHDEGDEIVNLMLAQLLEFQGYCAFPVSQNALASEMLGRVEQHQADVIVVSALPPSAVAHARYLCKRMHARYPEARMLVGIWTVKGDQQKMKDRITCVANAGLTTTLQSALEQIHQVVQPIIAQQPVAK